MPTRERSAPLRSILFDLDGTLVESMAPTYDAMRTALYPYVGRALDNDELTALLGPPEPIIFQRLLGIERAANCMAEYTRLYTASMDRITSYSGIALLLQRCRQAMLKIGVVTSRQRSLAQWTLQVAALDTLVDLVVAGDDVQHHKPSPQGIHQALHAFGTAVDEAAIVGDSPMDIAAGRAAGLETIAVSWNAPIAAKLFTAGADAYCRNPDDVWTMIQRRLNYRDGA